MNFVAAAESAEYPLLRVGGEHGKIDFDFSVRAAVVAGVEPLSGISRKVAADIAVVGAENEGIGFSAGIDVNLAGATVEEARHRAVPVGDKVAH